MLFTFPQSVGIAGGRPSSSYYFVASQGASLFYLDPHLTRPSVPLEIPPISTPSNDAGGHVHHSAAVRKSTGNTGDLLEDLPYTLDVIDVDELSDISDSSAPPRTQIFASGRTSASALHLSSPPVTPPSSEPAKHLHDSSFDAATVSSPKVPPSRRSPLNVDPQTIWYANAYSEGQLRSFHCEKVKKMPLSSLDPSMLLGFLCRNEGDFEDFCDRVGKVCQRSPSCAALIR